MHILALQVYSACFKLNQVSICAKENKKAPEQAEEDSVGIFQSHAHRYI